MGIETKNAYYEYMRQTAAFVNPEIDSYFAEYKKDKEFFRIFEPLYEKRLMFPQLRSVICRLSYEIVGGEGWEKIAPMLAANVIHDMYLYWHNWIFDNKNCIWAGELKEARKRVNEVIIAAAMAREMFPNAINKLEIAPLQKAELLRWFGDSIKKTYYGQFLDLNLTIDKIREFRSEEDFLELYELKSKNQSGSFYGLSGRAGAVLAGGTQKQTEEMTKICELLGTGLHISNDLGDFSPPNEENETFGKLYQDQMADVRENRLTLPVFYVLRNGSKEEKNSFLKLVDNHNPDQQTLFKAVQAIHTTGAFFYCKKYIRGYYNRAEKMLHDHFEKSEKRDLFSVMLSVIRSNKFLTELRKAGNNV